MLNIDQVRQLDNCVERAVRKITALSDENQRLSDENQRLCDENKMLQEQLTSVQTRVAELERVVEEFKEEQGRIEQGILSALDKLSAFEDTVMSGESNGEQNGEEQNGNEWNVTPNPEGYSDGNAENQNDE